MNKRFGIDVHIVEKIICNSILFLEVELIQFTRHLLTMPALLITAFLSTEAGSARSRVFRADCNKREELFASSP